eukprot:833833-Pyramimonas_sp.AAC.1
MRRLPGRPCAPRAPRAPPGSSSGLRRWAPDHERRTGRASEAGGCDAEAGAAAAAGAMARAARGPTGSW